MRVQGGDFGELFGTLRAQSSVEGLKVRPRVSPLGKEKMIKRIEPGPGQESVWDYPRPPAIQPTSRHLRVVFNGRTVAETRRGLRVLETSQPPAYYVPPADVHLGLLIRSSHRTVCEWKGIAVYFTLQVHGKMSENVAWSYPDPTAGYQALRDYLAFYPSRVDACYVDGEPVKAQEGDYYGGWITSDVVGPFKGGLGTEGW